MTHNPDISYFAETNARFPHRAFGIKQEDRFSHLYVIGRTGAGKTTLLETLALQDIHYGRGLCVIDPHGDLAERLVAAVPASRRINLVFFDVPDREQPFGYNPLKQVHPSRIPLAVSGLMEAFKKLWDEAWGVRMEHVLRNTLYALIEAGDATLPDILRMLRDKDYRASVVKRLKNEQVRTFWEHEFTAYNPRYRQEMIAPIQNKVGAFLADPKLKRIFTDAPQMLSFRSTMDEGKILIVNLAKGRLGEDSASLLGAILVTTLGLAAMSRGDIPESERRPFHIYIDEFQTFTTLSVANMISELRKFRVSLTLANQHLFQIEPDVRHAVLGNAGTLISFRVGAEDAYLLAREFEPVFKPVDLLNLPNYDVYLKLMIDGAPSIPFSAHTLNPNTLFHSH
ncbi:MAG: type IV secretion system DNA-binding domain-containing protein [Gammaproteobacteria bacterium]|nr:type IV secretion system DNA-binding domain-containing protein [Gammaproteobacteria bacterium]